MGFGGRAGFHKRVTGVLVGGEGPGITPDPPPDVYLPPLLPNVCVYKIFVGAPGTSQTHVFLIELPIWG